MISPTNTRPTIPVGSGTRIADQQHLSNTRVVGVSRELRTLELRNEVAIAIRNAEVSPPLLSHTDDWSIARALQAMELAGDFGVYDLKEEHASSFSKQLYTVSSLICLIDCILLIAELAQGGVVSLATNPMIGPSWQTLVLFGAKQGALIIYRREGWRIFTAVVLHAGIVHVLCNVSVQLFVGGYLNLIWGTPQFLTIYIAAGVFGNLLSCIALPDTISVGSSGAVLGLLTAWTVWIVFRYYAILT